MYIKKKKNMTVFLIGSFRYPRFRWVTFNLGRRLVHEAFWLLGHRPGPYVR